MAGQADFKVILTIDSQGNAKIEEVKKSLQEVGSAAQSANQQGAAGADEYASALMRQLGIYALITAGVWKLEQAIVGTFKSGIKQVDDYQVRVIGIAASLTDLAKSGQGSMEDVFRKNKGYAEEMFRSINLEAARHFATANEGMIVYNRLVQSGYGVRLEEVGALLTLTDKIKLATQGQNVEVQLNTEIIALMEGQARAQSLIAMELKSRLGPGWADLVEKHKQAGDLLTWLSSLYPGLAAANKEIEGTILAQWTTTKSLLQLVAIDGLGGSYRDIAGWNRDINDYLREHKDDLAVDIAQKWATVKWTIEQSYNYVRDIKNIASETITWNIDVMINLVGPYSQWFAEKAGITAAYQKRSQYYLDMKADAEITGEEGNVANYLTRKPRLLTTPDTSLAEAQKLAALQAQRQTEIQLPSFGLTKLPSRVADWIKYDAEAKRMVFDTAPVETQNRKKDDTGGGGGEGALNSMQSLVDRLQQDISKLSEGSIAAIDAWYNKTVNDIDKLVAKGIDGSEAMALAEESAALKKEKVTEQFYQAMAKEAGDAYMGIDLWQEKALKDWQGVRDKITGQPIDVSAWVLQAADKKYYEQSLKDWEKMTSLQEKYLNGMAAASPFLREQVALEAQALPFQEALAQSKLEDLIYHQKLNDEWRVSRGLAALMTPEMEGQLRYLEAQTQELKRQALDRKAWGTQGIGGGVKLFALDLQNESATAVAFGIRDGLKGAKSYADQAITDLIMSPFTKKKMDFKKIGLDIATSIASGMVKTGTTKFFSFLTESTLNMASTWQTAQQAMTAASTAGEAARLASASGGAGQTLGILSALGKGTILVEAGRSGAAAFTSVMEALPFPFNAILAPMAAAAAFAATLAFGSGFGGGGGATAARGYPQVSAEISHAGSVVAHQGWLVAHGGLNLAADERHIIAQVGEPIFNRDAWKQIEGVYGPSAFEMFNSGRVPAVPLPVPVAASGGPGGGGSGGPSHIRLTIPITVMTHDGKILLQEKQDVIWKIVQKGHDRHEINIQMPPGRR